MPPQGTACTHCHTPLPQGALYCPTCGSATPTEFDATRSPVPARPAQPTGVLDPRERQSKLQGALGGAFELRGLVGAGGFGEVWAAWDTRLKRDVAVKILLEDLAASPELHTRFAREAEAAARLRHPNIIPIYQVGEANGLAFIIMPLVRGESLRNVLAREGRLPIADARRILAEAASALDAAHKAGIVHRDVKPENIMLEGDERRVLLMDFGIARAMEAGSAHLTGTGMVIGTPQYMSPEQATAEKNIDHRADIYSLGVVAFEALTGALPFSAASGRDLILQHLTAQPKDPRSVRPDVPEDVADAVLRCMAKEPGERWPSAGQLALAFQPPVTTSEVSPLVWIGRRLRSGVRRSRRRIVVYAVALAAVVGTVAVFSPGTLVGGWRYWRWRVLTVLHPARTTAPPPNTPTRNWTTFPEQGSFGVTVDVAPLGDSLFVVRSGSAGPQAFDGTAWHTVPVAGSYVLPFVRARDGTTWVYSQRGQLTVGVQLTARGPVARDTIRGSVQSAWSDGSQALLALGDGGLLRGQPGSWHRDPTGTSTRLAAIAGDAHRQFAMGYFATADHPDSLLVFNGLNWQVTDPRPDTTRHWVYNAGDALKDGTLVVVGQDCGTGGQTDCRGLIARLSPGQRTWRPAAHMPADVEFLTLRVAGPDELWLSGRGRGCADPPCVYRIAQDSVEAVRGLGRVPVQGIAQLHGEVMALTTDGLLRTRRGGQWGVLGTVPGSLPDGTTAENGGNWSGATVVRDGVVGVRGEAMLEQPGRATVFFQSFPTLFRPLRCVTGDSVHVRLSSDWDNVALILDPENHRVALDDDGGGNLNAFVRWQCPDGRTYRIGVRGWGTGGGPFRAIITRGTTVDTVNATIADGARRVYATLAASGTIFQRVCAVGGGCKDADSSGSPRGVTAIARLGANLMAAAAGGRVLLGPRWEPMPSEGAMGPIVALAGGDSVAAALTSNAIWVWTGHGAAATWHRSQALPSWLGQPERIAIAADGHSAVVVGDLGTGLFRDSTAAQFGTGSEAVSDAIILPDGRVVLAAPSADPLVEGALRVFRPGVTDFGVRVTIPRGVNVRGLATDGITLFVSSSGWTQSQIRLDKLPFAPGAGSTR